jgi:hypothetical protein
VYARRWSVQRISMFRCDECPCFQIHLLLFGCLGNTRRKDI